MKKQLFFLWSVFFYAFLFAQGFGNLDIRSRYGSPMSVRIDGHIVNGMPAGQVNIGNIPAGYHQIRIVFTGGAQASRQFYVPPASTVIIEAAPLKPFRIIDLLPASDFTGGTGYIWQSGTFYPANQNVTSFDFCPDISPSEFRRMYRTVKKRDFDEERAAVIRQIIRDNPCLPVERLVELLKLIDFDNVKLELAKDAYRYLDDYRHIYLLFDVFDFDSTRKAFREFIDEQN